ncbi:hypothetical protein OS493_020319 [Desmophyllum pertusum]|uniref:PX domain-containing protein n=1 Tax=Desmophyllum pertusum TaxID=174260 RepID=A0A9X0D2F2_9CNID|nr:hypothetical protein OS493_020319 [Desmophyllum pertusum]
MSVYSGKVLLDCKKKKCLGFSVNRMIEVGLLSVDFVSFQSTVGADSWSVYRRYRKFRELHKSMSKSYYEVSSLDFPNRRFFGNRAEEFVRARRAQLETYLQSFIGLCSKIPDCPISAMTGRPLTKRDLCDFAPFFKQGIFEQTKNYSG